MKTVLKAIFPMYLPMDLLSPFIEALVDKAVSYVEKRGILSSDSFEAELEQIFRESGFAEEHKDCILRQVQEILTEHLVISPQCYQHSGLMEKFLIERYMELPIRDREYEGEVKSFLYRIAPRFIDVRLKGSDFFEDLIAQLERYNKRIEKNTENITVLSHNTERLLEITDELPLIIQHAIKEYLQEKPLSLESKSRALAEEFYSYWNQACTPVQTLSDPELEDALQRSKTLLAFLEFTYSSDKMKELCLALPHRKPEKEAIPYTFCIGTNTEYPLFYAQALLRRAQICIRIYRRQARFTLLDMAKRDLECAEAIVQSREYDEQLVAAVLSLPVRGEEMYAEICLARAELLARDALLQAGDLQEQPELLIHEYVQPCADALCAHAGAGTDATAYEEIKQLCQSVFFDADSLIQNGICEEMQDAESKWRKIYLSCVQRIPGTIHQIPAHRFSLKNLIRSKENTFYFEPVFSAAFDSVTGKDPENMNQMELSLFQLAASGKTLLLQPPQLVDNANMLRLIQKDSFRSLCKLDVIACSTFSFEGGDLATPKEYLIRNLRNEGFVFSSLSCLNGTRGIRNREILADALEKTKPFTAFEYLLDSESRTELEKIYDSYRVVSELFPEYKILRYHQNPKYRTRKVQLTTHRKVSLNEVLKRRIEELEEDENFCHIEGRPEHLQAFRKLLQKTKGNGYTTRSEYDLFLNAQRHNSEFDTEEISLFRNLIHRCYIVSNGFRSCDTVYVGETTDELCLHQAQEDTFRKQMSVNPASVDYFFAQYIRSDYTITPTIDWQNIVDLTLLSRAVFSAPAIQASDRIHILQKETGLDGYVPDIMDVPILLKQSAKTSDGVPHSVSTTEIPGSTKITSDVYTN